MMGGLAAFFSFSFSFRCRCSLGRRSVEVWLGGLLEGSVDGCASRRSDLGWFSRFVKSFAPSECTGLGLSKFDMRL